MKVFIEVPATIGNVGPGFDVLGLAVAGFSDKITMEACDSHDLIMAVTGRDAALIPLDPELNTVTIAAKALARSLGRTMHIKVSIDRAIPASGGLGASAASSLGGALGMMALLGGNANVHAVLEAALTAEAFVSGRHLDNIAPCYYGGLTIALATDPPRAVRVPVVGDWFLAVVTPRFKLATAASRGVLPEALPRAAWVRQMALSSGLVAALSTGNKELLRETLTDPFAEPRRSHLIPGFADVKAAALGAGAYGASISGAGPSVFALFDTLASAEGGAKAMAEAFGIGATAHVGGIAGSGARYHIET